MPVPLIVVGLAAAASALVAAGATYYAKESEKKTLAEAAARAEQQRVDLENDVKAATGREEKSRLERIALALKYIEADLQRVLQETRVPLDRAVRLFACAAQVRAVHQIGRRDNLDADDTRFIDLLVKNAESTGLAGRERFWLYEYLDSRQGDAMVRFLVNRFGSEHRVLTGECRDLRKRVRDLKIEIATLDVDAEASGRQPESEQRGRLQAELSATTQRGEEAERSLGELDWLLVVAARFAGDAAPALDDENALRLLQQRARGIALSPVQVRALKRYGAAHFKEARTRLREEFDVEILGADTMKRPA